MQHSVSDLRSDTKQSFTELHTEMKQSVADLHSEMMSNAKDLADIKASLAVLTAPSAKKR